MRLFYLLRAQRSQDTRLFTLTCSSTSKCHRLVLFSGLSVSLLVVSQSLCWSDPTDQATEKTQTQIPMISANLSPSRDIPQQDKSLGLDWSLCSQIGLAGLNLVTCRLLVRAGGRLEPLQSPQDDFMGDRSPAPLQELKGLLQMLFLSAV